MGFDKRENADTYEPRDDDTLKKIAERETSSGNRLTAGGIAKFNWGTDDEDLVNEFLRDELGCYKLDGDKNFVISADVDARTDLLIPKAFRKEGLALNKAHTVRVRKLAEPPEQFEACTVIKGVCFEFDKSFIRPEVVHDLARIETAAKEKPDAKILVFGHTDPVGSDEYNKALSERRALSTYAFITDQPAIWEKLYQAENWGIKSVQAILKDIGGDMDPGPVDGINGKKTKAAVKAYQKKNGLAEDGIAGPDTREVLFREYMTGKHDVEIAADRFMDPKFVGCGEFNPAVVFTEEEKDEFANDSVLRNRKHEPNRRVTFFLFNQDRLPRIFCENHTTVDNCDRKPADSRVTPRLAPCLRYGVREDPDPDIRPRHRPTFGCAWYDSIAKNCIVEGPPVVPRLAHPEIEIRELDKWFIPKEETAKISYALSGNPDKAEKVQMEVYASNYCSAEVADDGTATYTALKDMKVWSKEESAAGFTNDAAREITDWKGQSTAANGILKPRPGQEKHISVACSPYTVHLRYLEEHAEDTAARIDLSPFWPQFEETVATPATAADVQPTEIKVSWTNDAVAERGWLEIKDKNGQRVHLADIPDDKLAAAAQEMVWDRKYRDDAENSRFGKEYLDDSADGVNAKNAPYTYEIKTITRAAAEASLLVRYEIKECDRLAAGKLRIVDGNNQLVFELGLGRTEVSAGEQTCQWDGKYKAGVKNSKDGDAAIFADMPYRVQVSAHTGMDINYGTAVAAMHTEVRLYVRKGTRAPADGAYDSWNPKQSLELSLARNPTGSTPAEGATTKWIRHKLMEFGFHPGPVTDAADADTEYKLALREFKRSVPKDGTVAAPNFQRQDLNGSNDEAENDEAKTAIKKMRDSDKRAWFGDLTRVRANSNDVDLTNAQADTRVPDPAQDVIVWVDDRHYNTDGDSAKDHNNRDFTSGSDEARNFGLKNYRGGMEIKDGRTDKDGTSIARPWIPLAATLPLLSRTKGLFDDGDPPSTDAAKEAMRRALGPLRVDWTFDELPRDVAQIQMRPAPNQTQPVYDKRYIRSRYYMDWAIRQNQAAHTRPDTGRSHTYTNCKASLGGIRPNGLASYFEKGFGFGNLSLAPWKAAKVAARESIATVVHDDLSGDQTAFATLFTGAIGKAGVYFHPSTIAGDGYRVRAEAQFESFSGYEYPNLEVLKGRYPVPPQAHTARLRLWRKSSVRGYMCWGAGTGHWPGNLVGFRNDYRGGHVYFELERSANPNDHVFSVADVFDPADAGDQDKYKNIIANNLTTASLRNKSHMTLTADTIWPWTTRDDLGWPRPSPKDLPPGQLWTHWLNGEVFNLTWRKFRAGLLLALLKEVERKGFLRGHLMVEFRDTPSFHCEEYECQNNCKYWYIRREGVGTGGLNGESCPTPGCRRGFLNLRRCTLTATGRRARYDRMFLPAVGVQLGATWLFTTSDAETWSHEVGHHRHFEHSDNAPGAEYAADYPSPNARLHDNQDNTAVASWAGIGQSGHASERDWDRLCTMTYVNTDPTTFCGKCLLRNRGWKVQTLGFPGSGNAEP